MTKYKMTQHGYDEFIANRKLYILPNIRAKLMYILSVRVGYTLDSLIAQIKSDPRLKAKDGEIVGEISRLRDEGFVEVNNI